MPKPALLWKTADKRKMSSAEELFEEHWLNHPDEPFFWEIPIATEVGKLSESGLCLLPEYQFAPPRKWRFDYACLPARVAIEINGAIWQQGRHARGSGLLGDYVKLNTAASMGWLVFQLSPELIEKNDHGDQIAMIYNTIHERTQGVSE